jgi:hypothetical protein
VHMRISLSLLTFALMFQASGADAPKGDEKPKEKKEKTIVAVLPGRFGTLELADVAKAMPNLLATGLSKNDGIELVEREQLEKVLDEQVLGQTGAIDPETAAQVGKLLGARIIVTPSSYVSGKQVYVTAKVINVDTGRIKATTKSTLLANPNLDSVSSLLCTDIIKILDGDLMTAGAVPDEDKLKKMVESIKKAIGDAKKPVICVVVPEEQLRRVVPDPAVNLQLCYILRKLRFQVLENESAELEKWAKDFFTGKAGKFPEEAKHVDVVIYGGAITEKVGTTGNFHSMRARVELNAIKVSTGEIIAVHRGTGSAADVSEAIAGKASLEKATLKVAEEFITDMMTEWAKNAPGKADPKNGGK